MVGGRRRGAAGDERWQGTVFSAGQQGAEQRQDPCGCRCNMAWCDACMGQGWPRASSRPGAAGHVRGRPGPCPVARHASSAVPMSRQRPASAEATGRESGYLLLSRCLVFGADPTRPAPLKPPPRLPVPACQKQGACVLRPAQRPDGRGMWAGHCSLFFLVAKARRKFEKHVGG